MKQQLALKLFAFMTDTSINPTIYDSNYRPWPSFDELLQSFLSRLNSV